MLTFQLQIYYEYKYAEKVKYIQNEHGNILISPKLLLKRVSLSQRNLFKLANDRSPICFVK